MKNEDQFPTERLIHNAISAFWNGQIDESMAIFAFDFAAKLGDKNAQALLEQSKRTSFIDAIDSLRK